MASDFISANFYGNTLTVLTNNGRGVFSFNATLPVGSGPFVCAADVNGDGHVDLICANRDNTLTVLTNNGSGVFGSMPPLTVGSYPICVVAADVNGDGHVDLICANDGQHADGVDQQWLLGSSVSMPRSPWAATPNLSLRRM